MDPTWFPSTYDEFVDRILSSCPLPTPWVFPPVGVISAAHVPSHVPAFIAYHAIHYNWSWAEAYDELQMLVDTATPNEYVERATQFCFETVFQHIALGPNYQFDVLGVVLRFAGCRWINPTAIAQTVVDVLQMYAANPTLMRETLFVVLTSEIHWPRVTP